jgi:hypothetical protein
MVILRCTHRLLSRLHVTPAKGLEISSNVLGAWYANVFVVNRRPYVICMNERSFLTVVLPFKESSTLGQRMRSAVANLLLSIGIPRVAIDRELTEMSHISFGRTESRALLGNLKELMLSAKDTMAMGPDQDVAMVGLFLSNYLVGPPPYRVPRTLALQILGGAA